MIIGPGLGIPRSGGLLNPYPWLPLADGTLASLFADFTTEGTTNHYWANATQQAGEAAWQSALSGTFSRSSTKMATNASGLLASVAANALAFDHDSSGNPLGILMEGSRTNFAVQSQSLNLWTAGSPTVGTDVAVAPDGTTTADSLIGSGASGAQSVQQSGTSVTGQLTYSIFAKANTYNFVQIIHTAAAGAYANFDLSAGTVGSVGSGTNAAITPLSNGWYRISISFNVVSAAVFRVYLTTGLTAAYAAGSAVAGSVYFWGGQAELGAFASSYIPTTTTAATRAADALTLTLPSNSGVIFTFDDASTQTIPPGTGSYLIPTTLNRPHIAQMVAYP